MNHLERAYNYHKNGYNCCQSVLAAFSDVTGLSEGESLRLGSGFGGGAGTGELCGAVSGAVMTLGLLFSGETGDKRRGGAYSREFQKRFRETFGALRCAELLKNPASPGAATPAALQMGVSGHCSVMVVTAVELVEKLIDEAEKGGTP